MRCRKASSIFDRGMLMRPFLSAFTIAFLLTGVCDGTRVYAQPAQAEVPLIGLPDTLAPAVNLLPDNAPVPDDLSLDYVMGRFDPANHPDFVPVDSLYADRSGMYLRREAYEAFLKMRAHAERDSIILLIRSAARSFDTQKKIWEDKWLGVQLIEDGENLSETTPDPKERALKILRFSAMPGSSRHHWGTDIDLNDFENAWFSSGEGLALYEWLTAHAHLYGFCQPYTADRPHGYQEERWHWSYMPLAEPLTAFARKHLRNDLIDGFLGSEAAVSIDILHRYVLGINSECR